MATPLERSALESELQKLPGWSISDNKITKEFVLNNFRDAISFIVRLSFEAEAMNHHPELENVYNRVRIFLTTHDADNKVTDKDIALATAIESISQS